MLLQCIMLLIHMYECERHIKTHEYLKTFAKLGFSLVIQKTRTVRVRVPYPHCTGAARTQILDSMGTNTLRNTQKIIKNFFFKNFPLFLNFFLTDCDF